MYSIGEKIKSLRQDSRMTQVQLAESLGVSFQAVSKWENGTSNPDISLIPAITKVFAISADVLFDLVNPEDRKKEIYEEYAEILDTNKIYDRARKLMEKAVKEFPSEYKYYIMLGEMTANVADKCQDEETKLNMFEYAIECFSKVINECEDNELVALAKCGKHLHEEYDDKKKDDNWDPVEVLKCIKEYFAIVNPW